MNDVITAVDSPMESFKEARDYCQCMHKVASAEHYFGIDTEESKKSVLPCRLNPARLLCTCKACRHHGICSHILAVSQVIGVIDLAKEGTSIGRVRENHRPSAAKGCRQIQPDDGAEREMRPVQEQEQDLEEC